MSVRVIEDGGSAAPSSPLKNDRNRRIYNYGSSQQKPTAVSRNGAVEDSSEPADEMAEQLNASYEGPSDKERDEADRVEYYTVNDAIEHIGFGRFQLKLSVFTGMIWMVDAMEVMIMSIISPAARCYFNLNDFEVAMISVVVFVGVMIGAPIWGYLMDQYGRHKCLLLASAFIGLYGVASAFSPNYFWLLALRFLAGVNLASTPQAMTYYAEFLPSSVRGTCVIFIEVFWSIGTVFETALAMGVMPTLGWRYLLGFSSLPVIISVFVFMFFPESPHFLMTVGQTGKALKVLQRIAASNGKKLPPGKLVSKATKTRLSATTDLHDVVQSPERQGSDSSAATAGVSIRTASALAGVQDGSDTGYLSSDMERDPLVTMAANGGGEAGGGEAGGGEAGGGEAGEVETLSTLQKALKPLKELFSSRSIGMSTLYLSLIWFVLSFVYYGVALMTVEVLTVDLVVNGTCVDAIVPSKTNAKCSLSESDYVTTLWTTAAEFPGLLITIVLFYFLSRRNAIRLEFLGVTVCYGLMLICNVSRTTTLLFIFGVRALITGVFQAVYVYTPEVYPTKVRAFALSICSAVSRVGSITTPFVAEVVLRRSLFKGKLIYTVVSGLGVLAACLLPIETKGKSLDS